MVSTKHQLINSSNCNDSHDSIDWLSNRVQNLLEKTLACQKSNQLRPISNRDVSNERKQQQQQTDSDIILSTKKINETESRILVESNVMMLNTSRNCNSENSLTSNITLNCDEFDDLTEYYPIQKFHRNHNRNAPPISIQKNEKSITENCHLSDIISFHKNFLNSQINHLKRLSNDLIRIEKSIGKSQNSFINYRNNKYNEKSLSKCHCNHGNNVEKISNQHRKTHSFISYEKQCYDNLDTAKYSKHEKQTKILQTSISMMQKINQQINEDMNDGVNDDDDDVTNKSVQTSFVFNAIVERSNGDQFQCSNDDDGECLNINRSLSWFLQFVDEENYRIFDAQSFNLSEIFEQNQRKFKHRSLMRALRIKDNDRLRIETADQRKDEIVQVFLLAKSCYPNDKCSKRKSASSNSRPLSPITRRVFTHQQMRKQTEKVYKKLPEFKNRQKDGRHEDEAKKRRMMAEIFKQKLKDNAVRGRLNWPITSQAIST